MKRGTPDHWKMKDLAKRLKIPLPYAVGIMELLWHYTAKYCIQGDIGKLPNQIIAQSVHWSGDADKLVNAMVDAHWLDLDPDYRLLVHDWDQHADQSVSKTLKNKGLDFIRPSLQHHIYFIRSTATGLIKIGTTRRTPKDRIGELQISSGERLELLGSFLGGFAVEREVQQRFSNLKVRGEWFTPDHELTDFIDLVVNNSGNVLESDRNVPTKPLPLPKPKPKPLPSAPLRGDELFERLYRLHPKKGHRTAAEMNLAQSVSSGADPDEIERIHRLWCETQWAGTQGRFAPFLDQWLVDQGWKYLPNEGTLTLPAAKSYDERRRDEVMGIIERVYKT